MDAKQTIIALVLLAAGVAVFGFLSLRTQPLAQTPEPAVEASQHAEEGQYLSIKVNYPTAPVKVRSTIEASMQERISEFKANAHIDALTPEDIEIQRLGGDRKYTLIAEYKEYASAECTSYAYTVYEDTLGAHPNAYFKTFVFDSRGNQMTLNDLLGPDPDRQKIYALSEEAKRQVIAQLVKRMNVPAEDASNSYYSEGLSANEENFMSFAVDGDNLLLLIPPYQAAAYAAGSFEVRIPLSSFR